MLLPHDVDDGALIEVALQLALRLQTQQSRGIREPGKILDFLGLVESYLHVCLCFCVCACLYVHAFVCSSVREGGHNRESQGAGMTCGLPGRERS